jgi:Na+/H+-dicarboxylate symporter/ABC-type amino acid transport substrate-binding protein
VRRVARLPGTCGSFACHGHIGDCHVSLSAQILLALVLGLAAGVFFGELVAPTQIVGDAFVLLLQMAVLPYVAVSLVAGLGSLRAEGATALAVRVGGVVLLIWTLTLAVVLVFPLAFPSWESASFFSTNLVEPATGFDFLGLFIPANPFHSLSEAIVPSVVVFSVASGVALIGIEQKTELIRSLEILREAFSRITNGVVRLAPIGIFAIAAHAGGTLSLNQATSLQVYMATYALAALVMTFWTLPALLAALTPYRWRDVTVGTRGVLITAFATGSVFVVLSLIADRCKELVREFSDDAERDTNRVDVVIPVVFTFPSAGMLLSLSFVLFAGWIAGYALSASQYPALLASGVPSFFGATVVAIPFLLDLFQIPSDTFQLFLVADNIVGARFGSMLATMHLIVVTLVSTAALAGLVRFRPLVLLRYGLITLALTLAPIGAVRLAFDAIGHEYAGYDRFVSMEPLFETGPATVLSEPPAASAVEDLRHPTIDRVRERGVLRVGYLPNRLPWAFRNGDGQLVGFDIEMAHVLARDLGVGLEFVQLSGDQLAGQLAAGGIDVGMSGIVLTLDGLEVVSFSEPYMDETIAFVVPDYKRDEFGSRDSVKRLAAPRIAVPDAPYYIDKLRRYLPDAEITVVDSPRAFFRAEPGTFDALLYTAESGSAYSLVYPEFTVAVPQPDILKVPLAYAVRQGDEAMADLLSTWIELKRRDGTIDALYDHWILGRATEHREPRWSVIRNVLGWVE